MAIHHDSDRLNRPTILINRLQKASETLSEALENYTSTVAELASRYRYCNTGDAVFQKLSDDLTAQLKLNETKLKETGGVINKSWHRSLSQPALPNELLIDIFHSVLDTHPTRPASYRDTREEGPLGEPNLDYIAITHVCSTWRRAALGSNSLWTNIHIPPFSPHLSQFLARAKRYASLSGKLPLNIRLLDECDGTYLRRSRSSQLSTFIASVGRRVRSLELGVHWDLTVSHMDILEEFLLYCKSETLARLEITTSRLEECTKKYYPVLASPRHVFFRGESPSPIGDEPGVEFSLTGHKRFERIMRGVNVLRLNRMYPLWSSSAYHGLVELYLGSRNQAQGAGAIAESSLALIFQSSPGLRVLHFGLKVVAEAVAPPTPLEDLEILVLDSPCVDTQQTLLRLISPGRKLFRVNIKLEVPGQIYDLPLPEPLLDQIHECFARSQVIEFFFSTNLNDQSVAIQDLLKAVPYVRVLGLSGLVFDAGGVDLCGELRSLHLRDGCVYFDSFREFFSARRLERVTVECCLLLNGGYDDEGMAIELPTRELSRISPVIETISIRSSGARKTLINGWDY